jgi:anti-sigma factor RsiW
MRGGHRSGRDERMLHAYHDGELSRFSRRRFERKLARSPELRRELAALARLGELVRERDAVAAGPDLWDRIALRLPGLDAQREESAASRGLLPRLVPWLRPLGAVAATALAALAVVVGWPTDPVDGSGVVQWVDSGGRSIVVLENDAEAVTIIWMLESSRDQASRGGVRA